MLELGDVVVEALAASAERGIKVGCNNMPSNNAIGSDA
jgi:hypothetical protein